MVTMLGNLFHQDYMGREWYIAHVRDNWLNLSCWLWAAVFVLLVFVTRGIVNKLKDKDAVDKT
jgi:hypothetical protein